MQLFMFNAHSLARVTYYHDRAEAVAATKKAIFDLEEIKGAFVRLSAVEVTAAQLAGLLNGAGPVAGEKIILEAEYKAEDLVAADAAKADDVGAEPAAEKRVTAPDLANPDLAKPDLAKPEPKVVHRSEEAATPRTPLLSLPTRSMFGLGQKSEPLKSAPITNSTDVGVAAVSAVAAELEDMLNTATRNGKVALG